jgi:hypothetical protein
MDAAELHEAEQEAVRRFKLFALLESTKAKWIALILALFLLLIAFEITPASLPHKVLNTYLKYEEKSNGIREYFPNGIRESEPKPAR